MTGWHGVHTDAAGPIYVLAAVGTTTAVFRYDGAHLASCHSKRRASARLPVAPNGGLAYVSSSTIDVPELCWLAPGKKRPETLTDLNQDWADSYALAPTQLVSWKSPDGLEIEGLLTLPLGSKDGEKLPLIVNLHGGPHGRTVQALSVRTRPGRRGPRKAMQCCRRTIGAAKAMGMRSARQIGMIWAAAMLPIFWRALTRPSARTSPTPIRLAVIGSSYGGYLVNWLIGTTKRFQAAVSQFGIFSLATDFSNSQAPRWETEYLGGYPWDKPELYAERSPATYRQRH